MKRKRLYQKLMSYRKPFTKKKPKKITYSAVAHELDEYAELLQTIQQNQWYYEDGFNVHMTKN